MSFEPIYSTINASLRKKLDSVQVTNESVLRADGVEIAKVLSINATPIIESKKVERNGIKVNGIIEYSALYEKIDGMKEAITYTADFSTTISCEFLNEQSSICLYANIIDLAVKDVNAERITLNSLIEVAGYAVVNNAVNFLDQVTGDVYYQTEELTYSKLKTTINQNYTSSQEIDISEVPLRLLNLSANVIVNNVLTAKSYITVSGIVEYNICYEYAKDDATDVKDVSNSFAFKYEIDCPDCESTDIAFITANAVKNGVRCDINSTESDNSLNLEVTFNLCGEVCSENSVNAICDLFSLSKKLQLTYNSFAYTRAIGLQNYREKVYGVTDISEDSARIDKIMCVLDSNAVITKTFCDNYNLNIEGIAYTTIVYLNAEESIESKMQTEIPFALSLPIEDNKENSEVMVNALVTDVVARIRRGREIEIDASLELVACFFKTECGAVISNAVVAEDRPKNCNALSIYIAKDNDTCWTIAKKMCINPDELLSQNPKLSDKISKGDKVIVYRKR